MVFRHYGCEVRNGAGGLAQDHITASLSGSNFIAPCAFDEEAHARLTLARACDHGPEVLITSFARMAS